MVLYAPLIHIGQDLLGMVYREIRTLTGGWVYMTGAKDQEVKCLMSGSWV